MKYLTLNNGVKMPLIGFGTWEVRGTEGERAIRQALDLGYRLIDTAQMYRNEEIVGQAVRDSGLARSEVFLTSKLYRTCNSYQKARAGIEQSLNRLQTDYLDLMLIHEPYEEAPEMYRALEEACQAGKLRAIGVSNFNGTEYRRLLQCSRIVPAVNQVESHVYYPHLDLKTVLDQYGTKMQSWAPFTEGRRQIFTEPILNAIGRKHGKTAAQIALRYLVQNGIGVIPKSMHGERMKQNLSVLDFSLDEEDLRQIQTLNGGRSLFGWY